MKSKIGLILLTFVVTIGLTACGTAKKVRKTFGSDKIDYKASRKGKSLEVPPDLSSPGKDSSMSIPEATTYSGFKGAQKNKSANAGKSVLPQNVKVKLKRSTDKAWLVVQATPEQLWPQVKEFWVQSGFVLAIANAKIGIMETDWSENRANIPKGKIRRVIGKVFDSAYSSGTRDRFRIRLERDSENKTTELFLTHKGLFEEVQGDALSPSGTVWKHRKRDQELEIEMLKRLMVHIGVSKEQAIAIAKNSKVSKQRKTDAKLAKGGSDGLYIVVSEDYAKAWRIIGVALDRTGFTVEDRNRSKGIYYVRYNNPELAKKKKRRFWKKKKKKPAPTYQVLVKKGGEGKSRIYIRNNTGEAEDSPAGEKIMTLLHKNL